MQTKLAFLLERYLSLRMRSESEVRRYLEKKRGEFELSDADCDALIERYKTYHVIDDDAFAASMARSVIKKRKGGKYLRVKLQTAGVEKSLIESTIQAIPPEDTLLAMQEKLQKYQEKWAGLRDFERRAKAAQKLFASGFSSREISSFLDDWLKKG